MTISDGKGGILLCRAKNCGEPAVYFPNAFCEDHAPVSDLAKLDSGSNPDVDNPPSSPPEADIRTELRIILSNSGLDAYQRGATKQSDFSELHEKYLDQIQTLLNSALIKELEFEQRYFKDFPFQEFIDKYVDERINQLKGSASTD